MSDDAKPPTYHIIHEADPGLLHVQSTEIASDHSLVGREGFDLICTGNQTKVANFLSEEGRFPEGELGHALSWLRHNAGVIEEPPAAGDLPSPLPLTEGAEYDFTSPGWFSRWQKGGGLKRLAWRLGFVVLALALGIGGLKFYQARAGGGDLNPDPAGPSVSNDVVSNIMPFTALPPALQACTTPVRDSLDQVQLPDGSLLATRQWNCPGGSGDFIRCMGAMSGGSPAPTGLCLVALSDEDQPLAFSRRLDEKGPRPTFAPPQAMPAPAGLVVASP